MTFRIQLLGKKTYLDTLGGFLPAQDANRGEMKVYCILPERKKSKKIIILTFHPGKCWHFFQHNYTTEILGILDDFLGCGFKYFLFSPLFGEDEPILTNIFQMG